MSFRRSNSSRPTDLGSSTEDPNPENGQEHVYVNRKEFPRAWIAMPQAVLAETPASLGQLARADIDPTKSLILDPVPAIPRIFPQAIEGATARIRTGQGPGHSVARGGGVVDEQVYIDTYSPQPAYLFLADTYYAPKPDIPFFAPGFFSQWKAEIDGQPVDTIYRAFGYFRAIEIPAGEHVVRFYFQPMSFYAGVILSGVVLIVALLLVIVQAVVFNRLKKHHANEDDDYIGAAPVMARTF